MKFVGTTKHTVALVQIIVYDLYPEKILIETNPMSEYYLSQLSYDAYFQFVFLL